MSGDAPQSLAEAYARFLAELGGGEGVAAEPLLEEPPLSELQVQSLWGTGMLGHEWRTERHGDVRIWDYGEWNRGAGPDFLGAEFELDGRRVRGDIEIDPCAQDWERHGHGASPLYNRVALHVTLERPPAGWYTRNAMHAEVPVLYLDPACVRKALGMHPAVDKEMLAMCRRPLASMDAAQVKSLLMAAAAHRAAGKRSRFRKKAQTLGASQAWYEALAETLGYSANKENMVMLARRAPLHRLGREPEAILFGTAGFLTPLLPERATEDARFYHRQVWDAWWKLSKDFSLHDQRAVPWALSGIRPLNHPQRRVAALAVCAAHWGELEPMLCAEGAKRLRRWLGSIQHSYWSCHCTLASAPLSRPAALVGRERIEDFLVNYVYAADAGAAAWEAYVSFTGGALPARVSRLARDLFGERADLAPLLRYQFARQGLLQIGSDFCARGSCADCLFPEQLKQWQQ